MKEPSLSSLDLLDEMARIVVKPSTKAVDEGIAELNW